MSGDREVAAKEAEVDRFDLEAETWDEHPERVERAASVARQILERTGLASELDILDFGSGTGLLGFELLPHVATVTFADTSAGMLRQVETKLHVGGHSGGRTWQLEPGALALPQSYGAIVSLMTLHHVPDTAATLELLAKHVAPLGWLALCDLDTEDGTFHDDPDADVHHGFDRLALARHIEPLGFHRIQFSTPFVMRLERPGGVREYPLFLLIAQRRG